MGTHIVLFIKPNTNINFNKLIEDIYNSYKELGKGILIEKENDHYNAPNFIFNNSKGLLMDGNNHHITLNIFGEYECIKQDIIEMIYDAFDMNDIEFTRIGYIREIEINSINLESLKQEIFKSKEILNSNEFQLAYHVLINFNKEKLNCWKRYIDFKNKNFIVNYDINNINDNREGLNYKYIKEYIEFSDNYIDNDLKQMEEK